MSPNQMYVCSTKHNVTDQVERETKAGGGLITICLFVFRSWDLSAWQLSISELATNENGGRNNIRKQMSEWLCIAAIDLSDKRVRLGTSEFWFNSWPRDQNTSDVICCQEDGLVYINWFKIIHTTKNGWWFHCIVAHNSSLHHTH